MLRYGPQTTVSGARTLLGTGKPPPNPGPAPGNLSMVFDSLPVKNGTLQGHNADVRDDIVDLGTFLPICPCCACIRGKFTMELLSSESSEPGSRWKRGIWKGNGEPNEPYYSEFLEYMGDARSGYLKHGLSTWARHCDGAIFWDENREEIAALDAQSALGEPEPLDFRPRPSGLSHRWIRTRRLWRHIFRNEVEHYDWFVSFDDGGFPIENIRHLVRDMNPQNAVMMSDRDRSAGFGSFMSRGALKLLGEALDKNRQCPQPTRSQPLSSLQAYGTLWQCLHDATRRVAWDVELRHLLRCKEDDHSILNLKASTARGVCPYALFAFMVPEPTWLVDIHAAIYRDTQLKQTP
eukprot:g4507.t1